ncbi:hypothetical protein D3C80_855680 [compost metagenome]
MGVALQLLDEEAGIEDVDAHRRQGALGIAGNARWDLRLFDELYHAVLVVDGHHAELAGIGNRHVDAGHRHVGALAGMGGQHAPIVHLVDVVAGDDQHVLGVAAVDEVQVLVNRIGGALVPLGFVDLLLGGKELDELVEAAIEETPAALDVADQAVGLVLGGDADLADARVDAVGEGEVDDAELAGKVHRGFGAELGQLLESTATAAGQDDGEGVAGQLADEACAGLGPVARRGIRLMQAVADLRHSGFHSLPLLLVVVPIRWWGFS